MEGRLWQGNGRDREGEKEIKRKGRRQSKRKTGAWPLRKDIQGTHTEKDKKKRQCLWDSTALNWGISYSADKVENSTVFTAKPVIRK